MKLKPLKLLWVLTALSLASIAAMGSAWADGGGHGGYRGHGYYGGGHGWGRPHIGIGIGYWDPWYYPPFYYPPRTVVIEQPAPMVYIERPDNTPDEVDEESDDNYWYYCKDTKTYYPYVKTCRSAWQKVVPKPPAPR